MEGKRKGFQRKNNEEEGDSDRSLLLFRSSTKRTKMNDLATDETDTGLHGHEDLFGTHQMDATLAADDDFFLPPADADHQNSGGGEPKDDEIESDHSQDSDKFYSNIKAMEEGKGLTVLAADTGVISETGRSLSFSSATTQSSSTLEDSLALDGDSNVHVYIKVVDAGTNRLVIGTKNFKSNLGTVINFLKEHDVDTETSSSVCAADVSASNSFDDFQPSTSASSSSLRGRQKTMSAPAKISRPNDPSTVFGPSVVPSSVSKNGEVDLKPQSSGDGASRGRGKGRGGRANRAAEPLLTSTATTDNLETSANTSPRQTQLEPIAVNEVVERAGSEPLESTSSQATSSTSGSVREFASIKVEPLEVTPNRRRTRIERNNIASLASVDNFSNPDFVQSHTLWGTIGPDEPVFARWRDRSYYPGAIVKKSLNDAWAIHFDDGMEDIASEAHILPIKIIGIGTWTVYCPDSVYKPEIAIVVGQRFADADPDMTNTEYAVVSDIDGRVVFCHRKNLTLDEADAKEMRKQYQDERTPKAADLSVDNIVSGRRRRCGATSPTPSSMIRKLVAEAGQDPNSKSSVVDRVSSPVPSTSAQASDVNSTPILPRKAGKAGPSKINNEDSSPYVPPVEPSDTFEWPTQKLSNGSDVEEDNFEETEGLFKGFQFFITASEGGAPTDTPDTPYNKYEFREEFRKLIEDKAGVVVEKVGSETVTLENVFLISDNFSRTLKYIYALASGIPCLPYSWVTDSIQQNRIANWETYQLSAGYSIETEAVMPAHRHKPLKGTRLCVTGCTDEFYEYWKPIIQAAGAVALKPHTAKSRILVPENADVIMTDQSCPDEVFTYANENDIPVVNQEWLIQTIIVGSKVEPRQSQYSIRSVNNPSRIPLREHSPHQTP